LIEPRIFLNFVDHKFSMSEKSGEEGDKYINFPPNFLIDFSTYFPIYVLQFSFTTQTAFHSFGTGFRRIKSSNVIASLSPIKLTDVRNFLTDIAPILDIKSG
jgi:hypothetical protein